MLSLSFKGKYLWYGICNYNYFVLLLVMIGNCVIIVVFWIERKKYIILIKKIIKSNVLSIKK